MPLVYDAGALVAAERRSTRAWTLHREALRSQITPTLPAAVLGQVWRGRPSQAKRSGSALPCTSSDVHR